MTLYDVCNDYSLSVAECQELPSPKVYKARTKGKCNGIYYFHRHYYKELHYYLGDDGLEGKDLTLVELHLASRK